MPKTKTSLSLRKIDQSKCSLNKIYGKEGKLYIIDYIKGSNGRSQYIYLEKGDSFEDILPKILKNIEYCINRFS